MKMRMLFTMIIGLLTGSGSYAQIVEEFTPPRSNCCLANAAKSLADQLQDWNQLGRYHLAGWLKDAYSADGLHPNTEGYKVMAPIVAAGIQKALP